MKKKDYEYYHEGRTPADDGMIAAKKESGKEERILVDVDKIIKLRKQVESAIKLEKTHQKGIETDDVSNPAYQYYLGKVHSLNEFKEKLDDLIIQG